MFISSGSKVFSRLRSMSLIVIDTDRLEPVGLGSASNTTRSRFVGAPATGRGI
jgi:hypothetical protein